MSKVSLPMYARPELDDVHGAFWAAIRAELAAQGVEGPRVLDPNGIGLSYWRAPDLLFSQTCGLPYRCHLADHVALVGTPDFGLEGCPPGYYRSVIITRRGKAQLEGARFAYNEQGSQSGFAAAWSHFREMEIGFGAVIATGTHLASARMVAEGGADVASIDAVSWRLITRYESFAEGLDVADETAPTPGLPYITAQDPEILRLAVEAAFENVGRDGLASLGIRGLVRIPRASYLSVETPPDAPAASLLTRPRSVP